MAGSLAHPSYKLGSQEALVFLGFGEPTLPYLGTVIPSGVSFLSKTILGLMGRSIQV